MVELRDDLKTGELSLSIFAADLYDVVMQGGHRPAYEDPVEFFALTYPTYNLWEFEPHIGFKHPRSRVAALCFDKIDL